MLTIALLTFTSAFIILMAWSWFLLTEDEKAQTIAWFRTPRGE